jgi:hypothetical protein
MTRVEQLTNLGREFWTWRTRHQPRTPDDIPRVERPQGWLPVISESEMAVAGRELLAFERRLTAIDPEQVADAVDHRLLRSAMARVRWETDVLQLWRRHPSFYVDQSLGAVFDLLTPRDPDAGTLSDVCRLLDATPQILEVGKDNLLGHAVAEFAGLAVSELGGVRAAVQDMTDALLDLTPPDWDDEDRTRLRRSGIRAAQALEEYAAWLSDRGDSFGPRTPIGEEAFQWFLAEVAVLPFTADELLDIGEAEAARSATLEVLERNRNGTTGPRTAPPPRFTGWREQAAAQERAEQEIREFYERAGLLTQPESLGHYHTTVLPPYLAPILWLGVPDDLTGPSRLDSNGGAFFPPPVPGLPYFYAANAHDPRAGIIHEGVHYQQRSLSWRHPRELRREYYDSTPNEGIAFYNEELMLASGLFDDAPRVREIIYNFMRLRALRVLVDVQLATGRADIDAAAELLERSVPMDRETARHEAAFFASTPGQAMTYQVGKSQVVTLLADAATAQGDAFSLREFHDRLWLEGNVPIALQRWELLGDRSDLDRVDELAGQVSPRESANGRTTPA